MTPEDPRFTGMFKLLKKVAVESVTIRYSEPDEEEGEAPTVWLAIAEFGNRARRRTLPGQPTPFDAAAGSSPQVAMIRLCEQLLDGGQCSHCGRPTSFVSMGEAPVDGGIVCWVAWDAKKEEYVQDCGGKGRPPIEAPV